MDGPPQYKSNHGMAGFMNRRSFGIGGDFYGWGTRFWSDFGRAFGVEPDSGAGSDGFWVVELDSGAGLFSDMATTLDLKRPIN